MQGSAWVELINRIPEAHHDNLVAVTSTGAEIMVQRIMRLEEEFVILRGRPAGSTEEGRVLLLPWDQLNHVAFQKSLPEPEIQRIFGTGEAAPAAAQPAVEKLPEQSTGAAEATAPAPELSKAPAPEPSKAPLPPSPAPQPPSGKPAPLSKSILLARLRARMANEVSK
jgi:hypothetical protein